MSQFDPDLITGRSVAALFLPEIQEAADEALDPASFWSGFLASISGWTAASIGADKSAAILRAISDYLPDAASERREEAH